MTARHQFWETHGPGTEERRDRHAPRGDVSPGLERRAACSSAFNLVVFPGLHITKQTKGLKALHVPDLISLCHRRGHDTTRHLLSAGDKGQRAGHGPRCVPGTASGLRLGPLTPQLAAAVHPTAAPVSPDVSPGRGAAERGGGADGPSPSPSMRTSTGWRGAGLAGSLHVHFPQRRGTGQTPWVPREQRRPRPPATQLCPPGGGGGRVTTSCR